MHRPTATTTAFFIMLTGCLLLAAGGGTTEAAEPNSTPKLPSAGMVEIQVEQLHCKTCAKKLARKLYSVPGVMQVKTSVSKNVAYIKLQPKKKVDPSKLWAVTQLAGAKPTRLLTAAGEYKPSKAELAAQPAGTIKH